MVKSKRENNLVVIADKEITVYFLDDKLEWTIGSSDQENEVDIVFDMRQEKEQFGLLRNVDGFWFYQNTTDKTRIILNGLCIPNKQRNKLIMLNDGDIFQVEYKVKMESKEVCAVYLMNHYPDGWHTINTYDAFHKSLDKDEKMYPEVVRDKDGVAIYMESYVCVSGEIRPIR